MYFLTIDNPNGSTSEIKVEPWKRNLDGSYFWHWEEIGEQKTLEDDCTDRVEEEIVDALGEPNDFSIEAMVNRHGFYEKNNTLPEALTIVHTLIDRVDEAVKAVFS